MAKSGVKRHMAGESGMAKIWRQRKQQTAQHGVTAARQAIRQWRRRASVRRLSAKRKKSGMACKHRHGGSGGMAAVAAARKAAATAVAASSAYRLSMGAAGGGRSEN